MSKFKKGNLGGPGRPVGWRSATNRVLDRLACDGAEAVLKKLLELAQAGDARAAELVLKRTWSARQSRLVEFELPPVETALDVAPALGAVVKAVRTGVLTIDEGTAVAAILERQGHAVELGRMEERLRLLESSFRRLPPLPSPMLSPVPSP
jgi:hypothetical protein